MMSYDKRKTVLIGTGMVGMSFAYALLNQGICDELVLIDINRERAMGEAMDLNHGLAFAASSMKIYSGDYSDCSDADIVVICAGVAQRNGETRIDLLQRNTEVFKSIVTRVAASGFDGIFLIATNPVDIMTRITCRLSGFPSGKVIGSGTTLDTARLRYLVGEYFSVDPRNIHAYVIGEHGDSEFVPWSQALVSTKPVLTVCEESGGKYSKVELEKISDMVRMSAYTIIKAKSATYYGIGMALVRIVKAIFGNENSVLTISARLNGEYEETDVYAGVPCIVNREGVREILKLSLAGDELKRFKGSCDILERYYSKIKI